MRTVTHKAPVATGVSATSHLVPGAVAPKRGMTHSVWHENVLWASCNDEMFTRLLLRGFNVFRSKGTLGYH